jgi:hypothetical protein
LGEGERGERGVVEREMGRSLEQQQLLLGKEGGG